MGKDFHLPTNTIQTKDFHYIYTRMGSYSTKSEENIQRLSLLLGRS